jgi:PP-loop superfamily ATP-utilizing enzyme
MNAKPAWQLSIAAKERKSVKILMEKMGMTKKEIEEINNKYGVSAAQLIERMQLSKYQFVYTQQEPGQCQPCTRLDRVIARA